MAGKEEKVLPLKFDLGGGETAERKQTTIGEIYDRKKKAVPAGWNDADVIQVKVTFSLNWKKRRGISKVTVNGKEEVSMKVSAYTVKGNGDKHVLPVTAMDFRPKGEKRVRKDKTGTEGKGGWLQGDYCGPKLRTVFEDPEATKEDLLAVADQYIEPPDPQYNVKEDCYLLRCGVNGRRLGRGYYYGCCGATDAVARMDAQIQICGAALSWREGDNIEDDEIYKRMERVCPEIQAAARLSLLGRPYKGKKGPGRLDKFTVTVLTDKDKGILDEYVKECGELGRKPLVGGVEGVEALSRSYDCANGREGRKNHAEVIHKLRWADGQTTVRLANAHIVNWRAAAVGEIPEHDVLCDFTQASEGLHEDLKDTWRQALREKDDDESALDCFDRLATAKGLGARLLREAGARPESGEAFSEEQIRVIGKDYGFFSFLVDGLAAFRTLVLCPRYTGFRARIEPHIWTVSGSEFYALAINYQQYAVIEHSLRHSMALRREGRTARRDSESVAVKAKHRALGVNADTIRTALVMSEVRAKHIISDLLVLRDDEKVRYIANLRETLDAEAANIGAPAPMDVEEPSPAPAPAPPRPERRVSPPRQLPPAKRRRAAAPPPPRATGSPQRSMSPLKASPDALARYHDFRKRASEDGGIQYD